MATGIFCTVAQVEMKAGANCSATSKAEGYVDVYTAEAESVQCADTISQTTMLL